MATEKLNNPVIRSALRAKSGQPRRKLFDGRGLFLLVIPPAGKDRPKVSAYWRLKYRIDGVEKLISLGQYPDVTLQSAREKCDAARKLLDAGTDPSADRKAQKAARRTARENTFEAVSREWLEKKSMKWAKSNTEKIKGRFDRYLNPLLGSKPVASITGAILMESLQKIEEIGTVETAHRCRQYVNSVFRYALQTNRVRGNPTPHSEVLTPVRGGKFASITDAEGVGALMRSIRGYTGGIVTQCALKLAPLAFVRPGELRAATWDEIDLDASEWKIRPERMKMRRPHIVPLSRQALAILRDLKLLTGSCAFVFPSERSRTRPMSENTINSALRALGYAKNQMTGHGFRHMASTLLHDSRKWRSEVIERQLAHADRNSIRATYNAAEYLPERVKMMQWWADWLDSLAATDNIVSLRHQA